MILPEPEPLTLKFSYKNASTDWRTSNLPTWPYPVEEAYNLTNSAAVVSVNQSVNNAALALNPTAILPPRLFKVGASFEF